MYTYRHLYSTAVQLLVLISDNPIWALGTLVVLY